MDVIKIRIQTQAQLGDGSVMYRGFADALTTIVKQEGFFARWGGLWFPGIVASILREFSYSSFRFGLYPPIKRMFGADKGDIGLFKKVLSGLVTGGAGSALATPTDLVKIHLQREAGRLGKDGTFETGLHKGKKPLYRNTLDAFIQIYRQNGIVGLYKGIGPTMARAAFLAAGQLASYDHTKYTIRNIGILEDGPQLHVLASVVSALCATTACQPFDTIKTRIMSDKISGLNLYQNGIDCGIKTLRYEGIRGLYRGWLPSFLRLCPHFVMALPLWEQCRKLLGLGYLQ